MICPREVLLFLSEFGISKKEFKQKPLIKVLFKEINIMHFGQNHMRNPYEIPLELFIDMLL